MKPRELDRIIRRGERANRRDRRRAIRARRARRTPESEAAFITALLEAWRAHQVELLKEIYRVRKADV